MTDVTALMSALQPLLPLHRARLRVLAALLLALVRFRTTSLARLCLALPGPAHEASAYRRLQRFFARVPLTPATLLPLLLARAPAGPLTLVIDRTEWRMGPRTHNLLVVGYLHRGLAVPLAWRDLGKPGASSQAARIALLAELLERLPAARVAVVLGDREFIGATFLQWLDARRLAFVVRIHRNAWVRHTRSAPGRPPVAYQAAPLFATLGDGDRRRLKGKWTVYGTACYVTGVRERGSTWVLVSNRHADTAATLYRSRWGIETLFGALKSRGFDLEATRLAAPDRVERLFGVLALAVAWVLGVAGRRVAARAEPVKGHGRLSRSLFRVGLDHLTRLLSRGASRELRRSFQLLSCT